MDRPARSGKLRGVKRDKYHRWLRQRWKQQNQRLRMGRADTTKEKGAR